MKKALMIVGVAALVAVSWSAIASSDLSGDHPLLAQGRTCQNLNDPCGTATGAGGGPTACCSQWVCHNGICKKYQEGNQPCNMATPPCAAGLSCQNGFCK